MQELIQLADKEFHQIKDLVYSRFGINLSEQKRSLVAGRLNKVLKNTGMRTFSEYYNHVLRDTSGEALNTLINRISTNHTYFNREYSHFDYFKIIILPKLDKRTKKSQNDKIRIWSAGCSSGEEVYMLAILLAEYFGSSAAQRAAILGTDISEVALKKASAALYTADNVKRLSAAIIQKYFDRADKEHFRVKENLKNLTLFRRLNLMREDYPFRKQFDVIFCRNVMIYFDQITRNKLMIRFHKFLREEGHLFIGHSESLGRTNSYFQYVKPAIYKKLVLSDVSSTCTHS